MCFRLFALFTLICLTAFVSASWKLNRPALYQLTDPVEHGEGPTWDNRTGRLYFVDLLAGTVLSYHLESQTLTSVCLDGTVTPVVPVRSRTDEFVLGVNRSIVKISWDGINKITETRVIATVSDQFPTSRFNDGKADKRGRLWFGTMGSEQNQMVQPNEGVLYRITSANTIHALIAPVNISNGLAWNKANDKFYYIDTPTRQVRQYDFDDTTGSISNPKIVFDLADHVSLAGSPDGMTIDQEDRLWIALFGGGSVIQIDPTSGQLLRQIVIPARDVTSTMWGGPNFDLLFVTTSRTNLDISQRKEMPGAGSLFVISGLGTKGLPVYSANIV